MVTLNVNVKVNVKVRVPSFVEYEYDLLDLVA